MSLPLPPSPLLRSDTTAGLPPVPTDVDLKALAVDLAKSVRRASVPKSPWVHLVENPSGYSAFLPDGSELRTVDIVSGRLLREALDADTPGSVPAALAALGALVSPRIGIEPLRNPPLHALSLAIAQKCNLGCTYCYADQGDFGGGAKSMPAETATAAVDLLLNRLPTGARAQLAFLGGEPLTHRGVLRATTEYAARRAGELGIELGFSITTNGTLVEADDATFFERHGFAVTVSIDGVGAAHDRLRPFKTGLGSYERVMDRVRPLLTAQRRMQVTARVTVTPSNLDLAHTLEHLVAAGFHGVGFSPLLRSSSGRGEMSEADLETLLSAMIECGLRFERAALQGRRYPFLNLVQALKEIARGTHRPYPCGAGAGYLGVSADGDLAACHRFVNDETGAMGNLRDGIDVPRRQAWLASRHVLRQEPCSGCWARYLCGGGCHHEVLARGRTACAYIRGWLHYVLQAHERLRRLAPDTFGTPTSACSA